MVRVVTLDEVKDRLDTESSGTWDTLVEPAELSLVQGRLVSPRLYRYEYPTGLETSAWATGQLCQFLGMPTGYFKRCPVELQDTQFNYWIQQVAKGKTEAKSTPSNGNSVRAERWLVRARNEMLRGVLTERYVRLDHLELFAALSPALSADYEVDWFALSDESFHLRLHDARLFRDALPGDRLMAGVHIGNSEVGKRAVTVDALIYRLVCTNGLIRTIDGQSLLRQRHIAVGKAEFARSVQQAVREALAYSAAYLDRLAMAVAHPIGDVEKAIRKIALDWGLTKATEETVKAAILSEHSSQHETLYGLINGLTGAARTLPADERYALEMRAGSLLESRLSGTFADGHESPSPTSHSHGSSLIAATIPKVETMALFTL